MQYGLEIIPGSTRHIQRLLTLHMLLAALLVPAMAGAIAGGRVQTEPQWRAALIDLDREAPADCIASGGSDNFCRQFCSGSLVAPRWIVTAAHCVDDSLGNLSALRVALGSEDLNDPAIDLFGVTRKFVKSTFGLAATYADDIALLHLDRDAVYPLASLATAEFDEALLATAADINDEVVLAGWGQLSAEGAFPPQLQQVAMDLLGLDTCSNAYNSALSINFVPDVMLCAHEDSAALVEADDDGDLTPDDPFGEDACLLDSGGGLEGRLGDDAYLVGLVSFGARGSCGNPLFPSVYTRLSAYGAWIESQGVVLADVMGDLALAVDMPASAAPGVPLTATVTLSNQSATTSFASADFELVVNGAATAAVTSTTGLTCSVTDGVVGCHRGSALNATAAAQVTVTLTPDSGSEAAAALGGEILTGGYSDYRTANNRFTRAIAWTTSPDIALLDMVAPTTVDGSAGVAHVYATLANRSGHMVATGSTVTLTLPAGHVLFDSDGLACSGAPLVCQLGELAAGERRQIHLILRSSTARSGTLAVALANDSGDFPAGDTAAEVAISYNVTAPPAGTAAGGGGGALGAIPLGALLLLVWRTRRARSPRIRFT